MMRSMARKTALCITRKACMKHGVVADEATYLTGYKEGVKEYCLLNNAIRVDQETLTIMAFARPIYRRYFGIFTT